MRWVSIWDWEGRKEVFGEGEGLLGEINGRLRVRVDEVREERLWEEGKIVVWNLGEGSGEFYE